MKLAISTSGKDLEAPVTGFGRASGFILYETTRGDFNFSLLQVHIPCAAASAIIRLQGSYFSS